LARELRRIQKAYELKLCESYYKVIEGYCVSPILEWGGGWRLCEPVYTVSDGHLYEPVYTAV